MSSHDHVADEGRRETGAKERGAPRSPSALLPGAPSIQLLQHLQRTAGNQAVNSMLRRRADPMPLQRTPIQRDPPAPAAAPSEPAAVDVATGLAQAEIRKYYQNAVVEHVHQARAALAGRPPQAKKSLAQLEAARTGTRLLVAPYQAQGQEVLAEKLATSFNAITLVQHEVEPHATGHLAPLSKVVDEIVSMESRLTRVDAALGDAKETRQFFKSSIREQIQRAGAALQGGAPQAKQALDMLKAAQAAVLPLVATSRDQGKQVAAAGLSALYNAIGAVVVRLEPHVTGRLKPPPDIANDIGGLDAGMAGIDALLGSAPPVPAP